MGKLDLRPHIDRFARRFAEVEAALNDPKAFDNPQRAQELAREYARLKELTGHGAAYLKTGADLEDSRALVGAESDPEEPIQGVNLKLMYSLIALAILAAIAVALLIVAPFYHPQAP